MSDFSVDQYGTDAFGRPVLLTAFMHNWLEIYFAALGRRPRILQGSFMSRLGGGASASDGAHDLAKCVDLETAGLTDAQIDDMVWQARIRGAGAYRRDETWRHGSMPQHMHLTLGADQPGSDMAEILWSSYVGGGDGLGIQPPQPDYERRPNPLVLTPPEEDMPYTDWPQADKDALVADLKAAVKDAISGLPAAVWAFVVRPAKPGVSEQTAQAALKKAANGS